MNLLRRPLARLGVDSAERAEDVPVRRGKRDAGVGDHAQFAHARVFRGERMLGAASGTVSGCPVATTCRHNEYVNGVCRRDAQGSDRPTWLLKNCRSRSTSGPQRDRHPQHPGCQTHQPVESLLGRRIQHPGPTQDGRSVVFIRFSRSVHEGRIGPSARRGGESRSFTRRLPPPRRARIARPSPIPPGPCGRVKT